MTATILPVPTDATTMADLLYRLGDISAERVLVRPPPGKATEQDVLSLLANQNRLFELVDGTLVEKGVGLRESYIAAQIITALNLFVLAKKLGAVFGEAGMMRIFPGQVRMPDVSFVSRDRLPAGKLPREPIPAISPDLAVEVLSESNTPREMDRKRREYFESGVRLVWIVDPVQRTVAVYTSPESHTLIDANGTLDGGDVLPGFTMELAPLFALLEG